MKLVNLLALAQIVLVLVLLMKLGSFEDRMDVLAHSVGQLHENDLVAIVPMGNKPVVARTGFESQQLRQIIREELRALGNSNQVAAQQSKPDQAAPVIDEAEMLYRRDLAEQDLEFLKEQDEISPGELDKLMGDIARLDPPARDELFKMLNQAMNRGEIKGIL